MTTTAYILIAVIILVVAIGALLLIRQQRSKQLRHRFGPEYEHAVHQYGSTNKAEDALLARQKRLEKLHIHALPPEEHERFAREWHDLQSQFVDDPAGSIDHADQLVSEVMRARGYPVTDFERRAEDLSVEHPLVVRNFRAAHAIAERRGRGEASTEDLRQALVYYRDLFDELLEAHMAGKRST